MKVLIVDDHHDWRRIWSSLFGERGIVADTVKRALQLCAKARFDTVVLDFCVPDPAHNTLAVARKLRRLYGKHVKIIGTSYDEDCLQVFEDSGLCDEVLSKVKTTALLSAVAYAA